MASLLRGFRFSLLLLLSGSIAARAQARFDLPGPKIDIRVTRAGVTLPIAAVPNLRAGDQIWLHPDLPASQSVHYLLIATFLRGTTNPPPDAWFIRIETWQKRVREEGVIVTVPPEAQQAVLFLAPETGGDFTTLRSAVKGRPGIFVRASQDLNEAGFEQARIEKYIAEMKRVPAGDTAGLAEHSNLLARTLALRPNPDCFKRDLAQQYTCLTQTGSQTLLDDGHAQSIAAALSNGAGSDLINQASYTSLGGAGVYSAYVGAIVDLIRLTTSLHTAKYQYIPAIAFPGSEEKAESLSLRLNTAPSFNNPKSVIVMGLPAVAPSVLPPLRPVDPGNISCLLDPHMVLPIEGAPLVFSTAFAHDLTLRLNAVAGADAGARDIPLVADAFLGGITVNPHPPERKELPLAAGAATDAGASAGTGVAKRSTSARAAGEPSTGTIRGMWGFDPFTGPTVALQETAGGGWHIVGSEQSGAGNLGGSLIAGQPNHLQLVSTGTACIQGISMEPGGAKVDWKLGAAAGTAPVRPVDVTLNLQHAATPGSIHLAIQQFGRKNADEVGTRTFAEPARLEALRVHAGDTTAELRGTSLDQVKSLTLSSGASGASGSSKNEKPVTYALETRDAEGAGGGITLAVAEGSKAPALKPGDKVAGAVQLQDGRTLEISTTVLPPRPAVTILSKRVAQANPSPIQLGNSADLPLGAQLTFFLKSALPFARSEQIEIGSVDGSLHTTLTVASGALVLQDAHTILATFDPLKTFGASTFGPFRLRAVAADGTTGGWLGLATIVRLPKLESVRCAAAGDCTLSGTDLYLIDSVATDASFSSPIKVPEGYVETSLAMPRLGSGAAAGAGPGASANFFLRLRDDPASVHPVSLPMQTEAPAPPGPGYASGYRRSRPAAQ